MSALERGLSLILREALGQLRQLGRSEEATEYEVYAQGHARLHDIDYEDMLDMTVAEVSDVCERRPIPIEFRDHHTFVWGEKYRKYRS